MKMKWVTLSYSQLARGMVLCDENVQRLMKGAVLALKNHSWATAVFQIILAMEEQGRLIVLYTAYIDGITIDRQWWRIMFGDHRSKIALLAAGYFAQKGQKKWMRTFRKLGREYQNLKELAMYVSYESKSLYWKHPGRIKKRKAVEVFRTASDFIQETRNLMSS